MYRYFGDTTLERVSTIGEVTVPRCVARFRLNQICGHRVRRKRSGVLNKITVPIDARELFCSTLHHSKRRKAVQCVCTGILGWGFMKEVILPSADKVIPLF